MRFPLLPRSPQHRTGAALCLAMLAAAPPAIAAPAPQTKAQVQAEIWAKEQAIYAARGAGNLDAYIANVATDYAAWPPYATAPTGVAELRAANATMKGQELLEMTFTALALNGDTAVIYYQTHRTRMPDGTAVDQRYDVIHVWVREGGAWKVLGGMARPRKG
ncbi:DUF4440 domain-containing protein [Novosphingobium sp. FSY-8]|uniref:DUF4440 domain-containing protein n=1 Tax=Novosphingobium ovatum TaxID=1908523 RepID=A0ABW9XHY2_9SPHN|nr:nuclear transport factor 2 family protein [Novosphingobium ovatum]NBC38163.1 DUF4440 domain-containing protein [Novosphingobium ovatum]